MKKILILAFVLSFLFCFECFATFREMNFGMYIQNSYSKTASHIEWLILDEDSAKFC